MLPAALADSHIRSRVPAQRGKIGSPRLWGNDMAVEPPDQMPVWQRRLTVGAAIALLAGWAIVNGVLLYLAGSASDSTWARLIVLLNGVEAVAFAAAGFLFGTQVNRAKAEEAAKRADQATAVAEEATEQARETQTQLTASLVETKDATVEAAQARAHAEQADMVVDQMHALALSESPTVSTDPDREAGGAQSVGGGGTRTLRPADPEQQLNQVRTTVENIYRAYRARRPSVH